MAIKVSLRKKDISKGRKSLYLDFYPPIPHPKTGKPTRREFLGLYIFAEKTELKKDIDEMRRKGLNTENMKKILSEIKPLNPFDKKHNTETLKIAESIRQKRENFLNKPEIYSQYETEQLRIKELGQKSFIEYFRELADKRKASNHNNWVSALNYLESFSNGDIKFANLNESFIESFKEYLLTAKSHRSDKMTLSVNSAASYLISLET